MYSLNKIIFVQIIKMNFKTYKYVKKDRDICILPDSKHTETLVFLHGLGDSAAGGWFDYFVDKSSSPCLSSTKVTLLNAPVIPITMYGGSKMQSWYDIKASDGYLENFEGVVSIEDIKKNTERVYAILREEIEILGGDSSRVAVGGFSQGCAMALYAGLGFEKTLGGIIGWSGYLIPMTKENDTNSNIRILLSHGTLDEVIPIKLTDLSLEKLNWKKHKLIMLREEGMGHTINENVTKKTSEFIRSIFAKDAKL